MNPYQPVIDFENVLADYCGSEYAIAVESCTIALFLSLMYRKQQLGSIGEITIPCKTYPGVANSILHAGGKIKFENIDWFGEYELAPLGIWDAALRFKKNMFHGEFQCLSFHIKKHLPIGRGGAILTNDYDAASWFKRARFDGRNAVPLKQDTITVVGWNAYMQPDQAARGLQLFQLIQDKNLDDLDMNSQQYSDLSKQPAYES